MLVIFAVHALDRLDEADDLRADALEDRQLGRIASPACLKMFSFAHGYTEDIQERRVTSMTKATLGRWGSNLAVRLPVAFAASLGLRAGERVELEMRADQILLRRAGPRSTLEEMFAGKPDDEWRALYTDAFDWGPDVGLEIVQD